MELSEVKTGQTVRNIRSRNKGVVLGLPRFGNPDYLKRPWVLVKVLRIGANPYKTAWNASHLELINQNEE